MANVKVNKKQINGDAQEADFKSNDSVLVHGTATPYIALFTDDGDPILNELTGIPLGAYMTSFAVKLGEGKEDVGIISLDTGDPDTVDLESIQDNSIINVQWGYIYPDGSSLCSRVHSLEIKSRDITFDDQGTHLNLSVKDSVSNLRQSIPYKASGDDNKSIIDFMNDGLGQDRGIIIEMFE